MRKIGIVDDDPGIVNILEDIIGDHFEGIIIDTASTGQAAVEMILETRPDIVLLDYLLPDQDGLEVIRQTRSYHQPLFVMISEVSDKAMIAKAYNEQIEFFITKPINVIEVTSVLRRVMDYEAVTKTLDQFDSAIQAIRQSQEPNQVHSAAENDRLRSLFSRLGIMGSSGCDDLMRAVHWVTRQERSYNLSEMYMELSTEPGHEENVYALKKRIRRVIAKVFRSMASLGNDDFMNPLFEKYAGRLFDISEVHKEMRYLQGNSVMQGKINIRQFIESIVVLID
jgi:two-component system response regulator YcbB